MERFFNPSMNLDNMLTKIREMIQVLPVAMAAVVKMDVLTGLRPTEAVEAVKLLNLGPEIDDLGPEIGQYYNSERQVLEHFKYPKVFQRATKKAYISYLSLDNYHYFADLGPKTPSWTAIRMACKHRNIGMNMRLCRKIFASWLVQSGIDSITVDMLEGRCPPSVLARHYQVPDSQ